MKHKLKKLSDKITSMQGVVNTEEAVKTAFVLPMINMLGFDIFNPLEVVPEYTADVGLKKGEKVDYAINIDGNPRVIIECKNLKEKLDKHTNQLSRYFHVTDIRIAILTNGVEYRFYSDLDNSNIMDSKPFFKFNMLDDLDNDVVLELTKFNKENFDIDVILHAAGILKHSKALENVLDIQFSEPGLDLVKLLISDIHTGPKTEKVLNKFKPIVKTALKSFINNKINKRLSDAIIVEENVVEEVCESVKKIHTTEDEIEAFHMIKSILREHVSTSRIAARDTISYFGVLLDNNNRKPICRLYLETANLRIILFGENKEEIKHSLNNLEDIYNFSDELISRVISLTEN